MGRLMSSCRGRGGCECGSGGFGGLAAVRQAEQADVRQRFGDAACDWAAGFLHLSCKRLLRLDCPTIEDSSGIDEVCGLRSDECNGVTRETLHSLQASAQGDQSYTRLVILEISYAIIQSRTMMIDLR